LDLSGPLQTLEAIRPSQRGPISRPVVQTTFGALGRVGVSPQPPFDHHSVTGAQSSVNDISAVDVAIMPALDCVELWWQVPTVEIENGCRSLEQSCLYLPGSTLPSDGYNRYVRHRRVGLTQANNAKDVGPGCSQ
jgi:hypothetical protein